MKFFIALCSLIVLFVSLVQADQQRSLPVTPQELVSALPLPPVEKDGHWQLDRSIGVTDYEAPWLVTSVARNLTFIPNPPVDITSTPPKPAPPKTVKLSLQDTGFDPSANDMFATSPNQKKDPNLQQLNGLPVYVVTTSARETAWLQVGGRFIVKVETMNGEPKAYEKWLTGVNTAKLQAEPVNYADKIVRPYKMIFFDELNPAKSYETSATFVTPEEAAANMALMKKSAEAQQNK